MKKNEPIYSECCPVYGIYARPLLPPRRPDVDLLRVLLTWGVLFFHTVSEMDKEIWWWYHHHQQHHHHHHDHIRCSRSLRTGSIMLRASAGVPALTCSPYGWKSITFENDEWINIIILRHVCKYVFTTAQSFQGGDVYGRVANANVLLFIWGELFQQIFSWPHQNLLHNRQSKNSDVKRCQN